MPANVETMMYHGKLPWHGLGTKLSDDHLYDIDAGLVAAGLDWRAEKIGLVTADTATEVPAYGVRRVTDGKVIGVVGPRYHILQNQEAFNWFKPFLAAREASLHTAGSLNEGARVWVLAKLNKDPIEVAAGDTVEKYILLSHSHDGTLSVRVGFTPVRVVCVNTLAMAHSNVASKLIRVRHSRSVVQNLDNIRDVMNLANQEFEATAAQYRHLATRQINQNDLVKYVKKVLEIPEDEELSSRNKNIIESVLEKCEYGMGNNNPVVSGTWWTAYNGITEYLSYERGHNGNTRLNSLWFGSNATTNKNALDLAVSLSA